MCFVILYYSIVSAHTVPTTANEKKKKIKENNSEQLRIPRAVTLISFFKKKWVIDLDLILNPLFFHSTFNKVSLFLVYLCLFCIQTPKKKKMKTKKKNKTN